MGFRVMVVYDLNTVSKKCLHQLFEDQVARTPEQIAVSDEKNSLSYRELNETANHIAHHLKQRGVGKETLVPICIEQGYGMIASILGVLKAGGAYVPIDYNYPKKRIEYILQETDAFCVITQKKFEHLFADNGKILLFDKIIENLDDESISNLNLSELYSANLAYVIYTSGSTGRPKGVMVEHKAITNRLAWMQNCFKLDITDRVLQKTNFCFDVSIWELFWPLISGAKLVFVKSDGHKDSDYLLEIIAAQQITILHFVPSALAPLLNSLDITRLGELRLVICSGETLSKQLAKEFLAKFPDCGLYNLYGPTEAAIDVSYWQCGLGNDQQYATVPIGRAIDKIELHVLDENLQPVAVGGIGELYIAGLGLARGYLNNPQLTKEKFINVGWNPETRLYKTGDLVKKIDQDNLEFIGRLDDQIKLRGFRIELGEIECALNNHPNILQAVVVLGDNVGQKFLAAYYVSKDKSHIAKEGLRAYLEKLLPAYMVPAIFIHVLHIPLTNSDKADKKKLQEGVLYHLLASKEHLAPRTKKETILAKIWSEALNLEQVGIRDNFFALGGDSIISIRIIALAREQGLKITFKHFLNYKTIEELAEVAFFIDPEQQEKGLIVGGCSLSPIQFWFFEREFAVPSDFVQIFSLSLKAAVYYQLDKKTLVKVVYNLILSHDALRLTYNSNDGVWSQIFSDRSLSLDFIDSQIVSEIDISNVSKSVRKQYIAETILACKEDLDIEKGPLIKFILYRDGGRFNYLNIMIHHLIIDGVSWRILLNDFGKIYHAVLNKEKPILPAKSTSFKSWVEGLQKYAFSETMQQEYQYWVDIIAQRSVSSLDEQLVDKGDKALIQKKYAQYTVSLTEKETQDMLNKIHFAYQTKINDILLSALMLAYYSWAGGSEILLHLEGHGREQFMDHFDLSRTVGWFTSLFPVNLKIKDRSIGSVLKSIKEQLRVIPQKGFGYGVLRYFGNDEQRFQLKKLDNAKILFNYLGRLDIDDYNNQFFNIDKTVWLDILTANVQPYPLSVIGEVINSKLSVTFYFDQAVYTVSSIHKFGDSFKLNLTNIIKHCLLQRFKWFTPSDFPLAKLDQVSLDDLLYEASRVGVKNNIEDIYMLNPVQQGLLFHALYDPDSDQYFTQISLEYVGKLNEERFKQAWQIIIDQHDILRTNFVWAGLKEPLQIVHKKVKVVWHKEDWSVQVKDKQSESLKEFLLADRKIGFDFNSPGLMRFSLIKLGDKRYQFVWSHHHIILDGWCIPLLFNKLSKIYGELKSGVKFTNKVPQYGSYIKWLQQHSLAEAKTFWRDQLEGFREPLSLSISKRLLKSHQPIENLAIFDFKFSKELTDECRRYAKDCRVSLNSLIKLAWFTLCWKYSGQTDLVIGTTYVGRSPELVQVDQMIGLFINTLPTRLKIDSTKLVKEHLLELHDKIQQGNQYGYSSLNEVHNCSEVTPGRALFSNLFVYDSYQIKKLFLDQEISVKKISIWEKTNYPLVLAVEPHAELELSLSYDADSFNHEDIYSLSTQLKCALQWLLKNTDGYLDKIDILNDYDKRFILEKSYGPFLDYPKHLTLHEIFEQQAASNPDNVALVDEDGQLTYRELNEQANSLARYITKILNDNLKEEPIIGIYLDRSFDLFVGLLAILKAGGGYLALDVDYPVERLKFMVEDSDLKLILTTACYQKRFSFLGKSIICMDSQREEIAKENQLNLDLPYNSRNLVYILYTSGSTGKPKGAMLEHRAVINRLAGLQQLYPFTAKDCMIFYASICFDVSVTEIFWPILYGAKVRIFAKDSYLDVDNFIEEIDNSKVSHINFIPSFLHVFLENINPKQCRSLKKVFVGIEELPMKTLELFRNKLAAATLYNAYGATEVTIDATHFDCGQEKVFSKVPIGIPLPNTQVFILDKSLVIPPLEVPGEVYIGGDSLARGYLRRPELTAERFIEKPTELYIDSKNRKSHIEKESLYRTGDRARLRKDGSFEFLGRIDNQIKIRGFRVELEEIEEVLNRHDEIIQSIVIAETKNDSMYLVAYYTSNINQPLDEKNLQTYLLRYLPGHMVPSIFVYLDYFPLITNSNKVNRGELPKVDRSIDEEIFDSQTELEKLIIAVWQEVLNLKQISMSKNFFYSGGNSILAMRLVSRINQKIGLNLPVAWVFRYPTVKTQADCIESRKDAAKYSPIVCFNKRFSNSNQLFFVHPGFNGAEVYNKLAKCLDPYCSFFAIESYNLYSGNKMIDSIEGLADLYIEQMRRIQPQGPYRLGGWCMGGVIAYEMARKLVVKGEKVAIIYLLDSFPGIPEELKEDFMADKADRLLVDSLVKYLSPKYKTRLKKLAFLEAKMVCNYEAKSYAGKVVLFKATQGNEDLANLNLAPTQFEKKWIEFTLHATDNGFGRYVKDLIVHPIDCVHEDMSNLFLSKMIVSYMIKYLPQDG